MVRRKFLQSMGVLGVLDALPGIRRASAAEVSAPTDDDRGQWVAMLSRISEPLLTALADDRLREEMPVEARAPQHVASRTKFTHLEGFGRLVSGLAPWLELADDNSQEGRLRRGYFELVQRSLSNAVNPRAKDFMNFSEGSQPLVDASFLALGLLRGPRIWNQADDVTKNNVVEALKRTRTIKPGFNNWLLFSALIETFFLHIGEQYDTMRIDYALRQHDQWYKGDGVFGDGPEFHWDYYNSFVIQPYMRVILRVVSNADPGYRAMGEKFGKIAARYAAILERLIAEDGSYPAIGRSIAYRCGAFHHLAQEALLRQLPKEITPSQVRCALGAVVQKTLGHPSNFDSKGWLKLGLSGHQPNLAEDYISTGSLYLCSAAFLPLGLPPDDEFWTSPPVPWTAKKVWNGQDLTADAALKF
ncbi:DUF2264 domain-containing protein [bacterium]|nr:MAG: DUF2264 domain-containing protein [bacterium]